MTTPPKPADEPSEAKHLFAIRAGASLARLHGHPSNGADMTKAAEFFEQQSIELARLRAESMRGAVEALRAESERLYQGAEIITQEREERREYGRQAAHWANWLSQQSATPQPTDKLKVIGDAVRSLLDKWRLDQSSHSALPDGQGDVAAACYSRCRRELQAAIGGAVSQPECRAVQTARMRAESRDKVKP